MFENYHIQIKDTVGSWVTVSTIDTDNDYVVENSIDSVQMSYPDNPLRVIDSSGRIIERR